jgi:hypothetical protein
VLPCAPCGESFESTRPPQAKFNIRNILLTSPTFPRLYADLLLKYSPNSREAKTLRPHYQKICEKVNAMSSQGTCTYVKVTGVRCGSPALKGEQFCYFHQNAIRSVRRPKQSRLHPIALIEDEESIQYALMEVINALMKNTIDLKRATLILRALHIAVKNANRVKFEVQGMNAVTKIPEFAPPPDNADFDETREIDLPYNAWVPPKSERQIMEEKARAQKLQDWQAQQAQTRENLERARIKPNPGTAPVAPAASALQAKPNVRTAAPGGPNREATASVGADASVRPASGASVPAAELSTPAKPATNPNNAPPHNFKPLQPTPATHSVTSRVVATRKPSQPAPPTPKPRSSGANHRGG